MLHLELHHWILGLYQPLVLEPLVLVEYEYDVALELKKAEEAEGLTEQTWTG